MIGGNVDYCLAHLLRGIVLRFIAHPDGHTKPVPAESQIPVREADEQALISYKSVRFPRFPSTLGEQIDGACVLRLLAL